MLYVGFLPLRLNLLYMSIWNHWQDRKALIRNIFITYRNLRDLFSIQCETIDLTPNLIPGGKNDGKNFDLWQGYVTLHDCRSWSVCEKRLCGRLFQRCFGCQQAGRYVGSLERGPQSAGDCRSGKSDHRFWRRLMRDMIFRLEAGKDRRQEVKKMRRSEAGCPKSLQAWMLES